MSNPSPERFQFSGVTFICLKKSQVRMSVLLSEPPGCPEAAAVTIRMMSLLTCEAICAGEYTFVITILLEL